MSLFDFSDLNFAQAIRRIPQYDMHENARQEIRDHLESWGVTAEQAGQLLNANSDELAHLASTIQKQWKWPQFANTSAEIARLSAQQSELEEALKQMAGDAPERAHKASELERTRAELNQHKAVRQDQADALKLIESTIHDLTRTAGRRNALNKMLAACPSYNPETYAPGDNVKILTELQAYSFQHTMVLSDNGQTFESRELLNDLERHLRLLRDTET